ncbi:DNA sulfur modification protein DndD [Pseudomonas aeruginosa]|uniref:DNA sulfur modification protein DndD n=1 Tax=Pseudomonas aeruginosa TaxID=287 RepID=UPI00053EE07F|nr:DNA sulfur modification protein DndD [Pseudomonas aeruginosa]MCC0187997.1 DNA sulfur modification protein DndD [Pseudomonas aeruginosa]MCD2924957.1 DNA sulfur modification protein DndD [Pseudomonas aeruginosa]MCO2586584.1 DNA sulfur modification protein DndD [Pseudomonas aeruginosa]MCO2911069.1 DNA sulfur modification protein DndD [Pseudomonas aeruginosa]MCO2945294.1 DNA sulfur modification protein DndD [Pseudomonas aeruginosa]
MIIDALSVLDFRLFSGAHNFDLIPKIKHGKHAPIVLFGGLNGGGKTTILNALKLALYGKGVLGASATISDYHAYLHDCIHRAHNSIAKPTRAAVELTFRYAQHGVISSYHLTRDWYVDRAGKIKEGLLIARDGQPLSELSYDQAQSFLNELIPIGVSELFFFDGEKIASLAEETSGDALRESINKLLGLDLIERLDSDLAVLLKSRSLKRASEERQVKIVETEREFDTLHRQLEGVRDKYLNVRVDIAEISHNLSKNSASISARGGAWSASKEEESARLDSLITQKRVIEHTLHDMLSGLLPLAIPKSLNEKLVAQLADEQRLTKAQVLSEYLERQQRQFFAKLEETLEIGEDKQSILRDIFLQTFGSEVTVPHPHQPSIHALTDSHSAGITHRLQIEVSSLQQRARGLVEQLHDLDSAIETAGENLARAPDEKVLIPLFQEQGQLQGRLAVLNEQKALLQEEAKGLLNQMSLRARRLDELHAEIAQSQEDARMHALAQKARGVLKEFSSRARVEKLKELEAQFYSSFNGLARKKDRHLSIQIDPASFEVTLIDDQGMAIRKDELSAGEKQIFAISILEALARTSGRSLPVVIDTPLGRLDSIHRKKLVENYFPKTSHQVIILSTDTEIDNAFYEGLQGSISHSYHLVYSPEDRSTHVEEGYFWRWADSV